MLYLIAGMPTLAAILDDGLDGFDIAIALRALPEHDRGPLCAIDMARRKERRRDAIERDLVLVAEILRFGKFFDAKVTLVTSVFGISANAVNAVPLEELQVLLIGRPALAAELHQRPFGRRSLGIIAVGRNELRGRPRGCQR